MKKRLAAIIIILSINLVGASHFQEVDPLLKFMEIADKEALIPDNWEVTRKETKKVDNQQNFVNNFRMYELKAIAKDNNSINYLFEETFASSKEITVQYSIVIPKAKPEEIELTAVLKGEKWDEEIKEKYLEMTKKMDKKLFSTDEKRFTCVELIVDDTMENRMIIEPFATALELVNIDVQYDHLQNSMLNHIYYGYTPLWDHYIAIEDTRLNLQIAITELENEELSYKIGTPILITEY